MKAERKRFWNKRDALRALLFGGIGTLAGLLMGLVTVQDQTIFTLGVEPWVVVVTSAIQVGILYGFVLGLLGQKVALKVGLGKGLFFPETRKEGEKKIRGKDILLAVGGTFFLSLLLILLEKWAFVPNIPLLQGQESTGISPLELLSSCLYGGMLEEIMIRLFVMSLMVWVLNKIMMTEEGKDIPKGIYIAAILGSSLIFAAGHLPATKAILGLDGLIVVRCFVLNGLAGLWFGWLYWKKGLEYGMISHIFFHLFTQLLWIPLLY